MNTGMFSLEEVARIVRIRVDRLRAWTKGRREWSGVEGAPRSPVISVDAPVLTFVDLIELRVVKALLDAGVTLGRIRSAHTRLSDALQTPNPFVDSRGLRIHDGDVVSEVEGEYLGLGRGQFLLRFVEPYLKDVVFEEGTPVSLHPMGSAAPVVIDARVRFGQPTVEGTRVPTESVYGLYVAEGRNAKIVARAYRITENQVIAAVQYEEDLRKPWAA